MKCYIGIDLGGTNLRFVVVDTDTGHILTHESCLTKAQYGCDSVIESILQLISHLTVTCHTKGQ